MQLIKLIAIKTQWELGKEVKTIIVRVIVLVFSIEVVRSAIKTTEIKIETSKKKPE